MQISQRTLTILKNFVSIYPSLAFKKGNVIETISASKSIIVKAYITDEFPQDFCVYDLNKFISTIMLFANPELEFQENYVIIKEGKANVSYYFAEPKLILTPPTREIVLPSVDAEFLLSNQSIQDVSKALRTLSLGHIAFIGDGEKLFVAAIDAGGAIADKFLIEVGETDQKFKAVFDSSNIKLLEGDYSVQISAAGIASFTSEDISYKILMDKRSSEF